MACLQGQDVIPSGGPEECHLSFGCVEANVLLLVASSY